MNHRLWSVGPLTKIHIVSALMPIGHPDFFMPRWDSKGRKKTPRWAIMDSVWLVLDDIFNLTIQDPAKGV